VVTGVQTCALPIYTLRITMTGNHIIIYFDGSKKIEKDDSTFPDSGKVGLWTKADAVSNFDDFTVTSLATTGIVTPHGIKASQTKGDPIIVNLLGQRQAARAGGYNSLAAGLYFRLSPDDFSVKKIMVRQ
jgi:hypothetical protein